MRIKVGKDCEGYMLDCVCSLSELVLELGDWLRFVNKLQILVSVLVSKEVKFSYSIGLEWEREIWKQKKIQSVRWETRVQVESYRESGEPVGLTFIDY